MAKRAESALKYDVAIDPATETSHTRVLRLVGHDVRVLDLGCATGKLAELLHAQGCTVVGVERDPEAATLAETFCERVVVADLEDDLSFLADLGTFDVVVAADVLEHVTDPAGVLKTWALSSAGAASTLPGATTTHATNTARATGTERGSFM